ncbi:FLYWCH-type zinc finger-containing protein 1-like [Leguminivora glycinivorella]|uniref:FLYWCH-type zinc finger-containing protein 1-like n=1 Tax=Leguminivora glycinivorella TaxID=1035111 RepID=UPI00200D285C|nr:FLYWCH-type zinc finger-containing protein 1-like [Leguminivora glycinivorella]
MFVVLDTYRPYFTLSQKGKRLLIFKGFSHFEKKRQGAKGWWSCSKQQTLKCRASLRTADNKVVYVNDIHNHEPNFPLFPDDWCYFTRSRKGNRLLVYNGFSHYEKRKQGHKISWRCSTQQMCHASLFHFVRSKRGKPLLVYNGFTFYQKSCRNNRIRWVCSSQQSMRCNAAVSTSGAVQQEILAVSGVHNHEPPPHTVARFITSKRGKLLLVHDGFTYYEKSKGRGKIRWCCSTHEPLGCRAAAYTVDHTVVWVKSTHNHQRQRELNTKFSTMNGVRVLVHERFTYRAKSVRRRQAALVLLRRRRQVSRARLHLPRRDLEFTISRRGKRLMVYDGFTYYMRAVSGAKLRWCCSTHGRRGCRAEIYTLNTGCLDIVMILSKYMLSAQFTVSKKGKRLLMPYFTKSLKGKRLLVQDGFTYYAKSGSGGKMSSIYQVEARQSFTITQRVHLLPENGSQRQDALVLFQALVPRMPGHPVFTTSRRGRRLLRYKGYTYFAKAALTTYHNQVRWCCSTHGSIGSVFTTSRRGRRLLTYKGYTYYVKAELTTHHNHVRWCCSTHGSMGSYFIPSARGKTLIKLDGYTFCRDKASSGGIKVRWRCSTHNIGCCAYVVTVGEDIVYKSANHNHPPRFL